MEEIGDISKQKEIQRRIKVLRKLLGLTQKEFSKKIGLKGVAMIESGKRNVTERSISEICREYNVKVEWLKDGKEPIFRQDSLFEEIKNKYELDELTTEVVKNFLELDKKTKEDFIKYFVKIAESYYLSNPKKMDELLKKVERKEEDAK